MTLPFDTPPTMPTPPPVSSDPIALVATSQQQVDDYLAAGRPPGQFVVVLKPEDVPEKIGGMAILCEEVPQNVRDELLVALGVKKASGPKR